MASTDLNLPSWIREHFSALYTAPDEEFDLAFDAAFSRNATITINGQNIEQEQHKHNIKEQRGPMTSSKVEFRDLIEEEACYTTMAELRRSLTF